MKKITTLWILIICASLSHINANSLPINKVVIWGHKPHTHTHSYIHWGFYRAFKSMGYDTYWFDAKDDVSSFDFSNTLFLTEWQSDANIPIRNDSFYLVHNMFEGYDREHYHLRIAKYKSLLPQRRVINFRGYQVGKRDPLCQQFDKYSYCNKNDGTIYILWGTDLLPEEIEENKNRIQLHSKSKEIFWVGTIGAGEAGNKDEIEGFKKACSEKGIRFIHKISVSIEENINLIQRSYLAPAIQGHLQVERGYIPCRIFKNISYGHFGITNSKEVYELFNKQIIYHPDTYQLFFKAEKEIGQYSIEKLQQQMNYVKENHTYINRIQTLIAFAESFYRGS